MNLTTTRKLIVCGVEGRKENCNGGAVASWLYNALDSGASPGSSPGRGQCVVFLGRHFTLIVPLSTQVYKWVPAICWGNPYKIVGE